MDTGAADVAARAQPAIRLQLLPPSTEDPLPTTPGAPDYNLLLVREQASADAETALWQTRIAALLRQHHQPTAQDPDYLPGDIAHMAAYFSRYPAVRNLFEELAGQRWQWRYASGAAETQVTSSRVGTPSALVLFDPRSGAQFQFQRLCEQKLPFCYTAPADVLLHELLHVHGILGDAGGFIAQGGLNPYLYPHAHEQQTIRLERQLYAGMTAHDGVPRPRRSEHTGRRTTASCVTCLR